MANKIIKTQMLGQVGLKLDYLNTTIFIDPYLSDYVEKKEGSELKRLKKIPIDPSTITDADIVLITHSHIDHCDPETIVPIAKASPKCKFICSKPVTKIILDLGIAYDRIMENCNSPLNITDEIRVHTIPAAHPKIVPITGGGWESVGYVIELSNRKIYHAGDTSVHAEIINKIKTFKGIDYAFIPVNEQNYYREEQGITGNMSIRDAFNFSISIGVKTLVPTHWDMFACNQVYREEIELLYKMINPPFELLFTPNRI